MAKKYSDARTKESILRKDNKTTREKEYEKEIERLKAKIAYLESLESLKPFLKKIRPKELKYKAILKIEHLFPINLLCTIAGVKRSAYYKFKNRPLAEDTPLEQKIIDLYLYEKSNKRAG